MIFKKQSFSPNLSKFFSRQGEAIDARHKRCAAWWRPHLTNCRDYIERHLPKSKSVAVLGAGRLLDIDPDLLLSRCETVHLFDADHTAVRYWKSRFGSTHRDRLVFRNLDLTDCLDHWIRSLPRAAPTNYLNSLEAPVPEWSKEPFDGYISLNLLGQIPLYWRDRVVDQYSDISPEESQALVNSMGQLQEAHLRALISGKDRWSILLTDTEYYFYHCDRSEWRVEPALFGKAEGLYASEFAKLPAGEAWLWHIAPQFIEDDAEGEIHLVEARFRR
jgi:hypothetical protein